MRLPNRLSNFLLLTLLVAAIWLPRVANLNSYVTIDEPLWLARSANFLQAISTHEFENTYQREHPGVTVMWLGALGIWRAYPQYVTDSPGQFDWGSEDFEQWLWANTSIQPMDLLATARFGSTLAISFVTALYFFCLRPISGTRLAIGFTLAAGWIPFFVGLSQLLHPNALLAPLMFLSFLSFFTWLQKCEKQFLLLSGVSFGLALLTKVTAVLILPVVAILAGLKLLSIWNLDKRDLRRKSQLIALLTGVALWILSAVLVFFILWPSMWVQPVNSLYQIAIALFAYQTTLVIPHFFMGEVTLDPGWAFYPVTLLLRSSPATVIGLALLPPFYWLRAGLLNTRLARQFAGALCLYILIYAAGMSTGGQKFDRYILPIMPATAILAFLGWSAAAAWIHDRLQPLSGSSAEPRIGISGIILSAALMTHFLPVLVYYPEYSDYFNPLLGGVATAVKTVTIGWTDGYGQAAQWLRENTDPTQDRIVAWFGRGTLSFFLPDAPPILDFDDPAFWIDAQYAAVHINQRQRGLPNWNTLAYFAEQQPVHTVQIDGEEYVRIYDMRNTIPPKFTGIVRTDPVLFDDKVELQAYQINADQLLTGETLSFILFFKSMVSHTRNYRIVTTLAGADGVEIAHNDSPFSSFGDQKWPLAWPVYEIRPNLQSIPIPNTLQAGTYQVLVRLVDVAGRPLFAVEPDNSPIGASGTKVFEIPIQGATGGNMRDAQWPTVKLTSVRHPSTVKAGDQLRITVAAEGQTDGSDKLSLRLIDSDGNQIAQQDHELHAEMVFELTAPSTAPSGRYSLVVVLYDPVTVASIATIQNQHQIVVSTVMIY